MKKEGGRERGEGGGRKRRSRNVQPDIGLHRDTLSFSPALQGPPNTARCAFPKTKESRWGGDWPCSWISSNL